MDVETTQQTTASDESTRTLTELTAAADTSDEIIPLWPGPN